MIKKVLGLIGCLAGLLFLSCEVGLGESVDVMAPSLEISSPEDGSIIMNNFTMSGSTSDDKLFVFISIKVNSTSTGAQVASYNGSVDTLHSSWSCSINNRHTAADGSYYFDIPDGEYTFSVTAMDKVGRTTTKSRVYKIDNTAPVVVLKRPDADDSYGKTIKLTGDIADANTLSSLYFTAYKMNSQNELEKITTIRQGNISGVGLDLIVAKKYDNPTTEAEKKLTELYNLMYNTRADGEDTAKIYCVVEVADSAKEYKPGSSIIRKAAGNTYTESGFTPTGNLSTSYYIYDVIYDSIYSESNSNSYRLTNSDLVSIMNGTYTDTDKAALVKTYLSENCMDTSGTELSADKVSAFNLNPANSPYFEVSGYKYENGFSSISNESKITVTVSPGRDQISLKEKTIRLVLKQCDSSGVLSDEDEVVLVESLENIEKIEDAAERAAAKNVRDQALSTGDTIKIVTSIGKRKAKNYYVVCVEGCDLDGNPIENSDGNIYGFLVESVSKPPVITITSSPEDLSVQNTYDFEFEGTLTYDEDHVYTKYVVTAKNEKDSSETEHSIASGVMDVKDDGTWSLSLPATLFTNAGLTTDALYMCTVQFIAGYSEDFSDGSSVSVRVHVDTAKPTMSAISVSPYYSIDASTKVPTVNGTITISANVSDNYEFYETNYEIYYMDGTTKRTIQGTRLTDFAIELKNINTVIDGMPVYDLLVDFECVDKAGNKQNYSHTIKVDQNTDKPEINFSNLDESITEKAAVGENANLFGQTGSNKILGTVTDDDRLNSIVFEYAPLNSSEWKEFFRKDFTSSENYVTYNLSAALQQGLSNTTALAEGFWQIRYTVTDKDGGSDSVSKSSSAICLAVDNGAPTMSITTASGELIGKYADKEIQGTVSDGNGVVKIYRYSTDNTRNASKTSEYGTVSSPHVIFENAAGISSKDWTDTISATDNGDEFAYIAEDIFGRTTKLLFSYQIDTVNPLIDVTSPTTAAKIYVGSPYIASFRGTAEDPKYVKIADGTPIKLAAYSELPPSALDAYKHVDASDISGVIYVVKDSNGDEITRGTANGTVSWSANIELRDSSNNPYEDAASIEFYAEDGGSLPSSVVSYQVVVDTAAPVVEITSVTNSAGTALAEKDEVYYTNDGIIIKGTVTEKNLKSVTCSLNDATVVLGTYDESTGKTPFTYTVDSASAGRKTFGFTAEDLAGQMSDTVSVVIVKDLTPPVISGLSLADSYEKTSGVFYVKSGTYTLSGTTTDTYAVEKTVVTVKNGTTEITSSTLTDSAWSVDLDFSDSTVWTDSTTATVEITASDVAGNASAVQTVTVKFDTLKPALNTFLNWKGKDMLFLINTGKYKVGTFGKSTMMEIEGCYNETGSGIKAVYYQIIPTGSSSSTVLMDDSNYESKATGKFEASSTKDFTIKENESDTASTVSYSNVFKVNLSGFKESSATDSNKLRLVAVDNVGNVSAVEEKTLNVDTTAPVFKLVASVEKLTNAEADITVSGSDYYVTDSGAGFIPGSENEDPTEGPVSATINGIAVTGTVGTVTNILEATTEYPDASSKKAYYSVTINQSYLATLESGNYIIKVTAKDAANDGDGNESYTNIATVVIDKDAPNLDIVNVTPKVGENVNGKVKVSGTASDGNALKSVTLYTGAKATDAGDVDEITYSSATYYKIEQDSTSTEYNWSATIDTTKYTDGSTVKLLAVAEDEAGNKTYKTEDLIIKQSTDKPALNLTSLDASVTEYNEDAKDTNLLGMGSNIIYGNVSDDDGIASINIKVDDGSVINKTESAGGATSASIALDLSNFASLTAGEHKLYITVTDIKNETSYATNSDSVNGTYFAYDNDSPSIEVVKCNDSSYSSNMWGKSEFDIYIAIADSSDSENGKNLSIECKGISKSSTGNSGSYTAQTLPTAEKAGTWTATATIGGDSISNVWKFTTSNGEGYYKRTYEVTDRYGRSASIEVSYRVDTTAPVFKAYTADDNTKHVKADVTKLIINGGSKYFVDAGDAGYSISAVDSASKPVNWFNQTQLTVTGEVEETNLKSVTLSHGGNESTQLNKNFAFSESFVNGQNTFTLTALDEAGNSVSLPSSGFYALYVDTNAPTVSVKAKKADGTTEFEAGTVLGASGVIKLNITAADNPTNPTDSEMTSGISKVYIGTSASVDSSSAIATVTASELEDASNVYTFTVGSSLDDGSYTLYVRAEDVAGNLSTGEEAAAFVVDKTAPKVTIASPVTGKTVDKKITISGTVQDSNLDASESPVLWIKEKTSGSWAKASDDSVSNRTYSAGDWSLKFDTEKYDDEKDYDIAVVFTDKAGNATAYSSSTHTIHVSQDNDRPVIIFSNVELESTMSSSSRKMIKNNQITGTVTDSDGAVSAVYIQVLDKGASLSDTDSAWGTSIYDSSSSLWSYTFPSDGSLDGEKDIYFKVVDAEETPFVSAVAANYLTSPKLQYKTVKFETSEQSTILYASVDMINPELKRFAFTVTDAQTIAKEKIGASTDYSYTLGSITDEAFGKLVTAAGTDNSELAGWSDISLASVFGGSNKTVYLLACGYDTTSIDKLELKAAGSELTAIKTKKDSDSKYIYGLYKLDFSTAAYENKYQKIDVQLSVYDTATRQVSKVQNVTVDNKAPTVEIKSPNSDGNYFYGTASNSIMGATDDDSSVQSVYLGFSKNDTDAPSPSSYTDILSSRDGSSATTLSASSWIINFDGKTSTATDYSHMEEYNSFVKTVWGYGDTIPSNVTEAPLYIWAYAKDSLGNSGTPVSVRKINIYTQGDIPSIDEVSYPDEGGTVGGTVRVTGSASIADTSVSIEAILIQIDLSYETAFNESWEDELTALINNSGDLKTTLEAEYPITEVTLGDGTTICGIKATGTNSWNLPINKYKEFNLKDADGKDKNREMAIRVYAVNNATYKKAGNPKVVTFTLDPGSPVFGNKEPLKLVQYKNNDARTGGVKASRLYTENMWISGKWWLEGSIEDDSGIKQVTVAKNGGTAGNIDASYIEDTSEPSDGTYKNKTLKMPVGTDETDKFGTEIYEITAYEGAEDNKSTPITITLNYDNKPPVFDCTTLESEKTNSIVQSDGTYEIRGTLREDSSASGNQSGFERIAFSITKTSGGKTYIVDPMISQGSTGDANVYEIGTDYSDDVKVVQDSTDGLYWRKETGCTTSGKEISLSGSTAPANVRTGGLCKVDGAIYRIESVSGSKVYVKKELPTYAGGETGSTVDVYFAIAQVIDNTVKEVGNTTTFDDSDNSIDNDDGDKMVDYYLDSNSQWLCSINSKNIKDGLVKINFTAFDQAGNPSKASYDGLVSNNRPRIAGVSFATDRNGDDSIATDEYVKTYSGLFAANGLHKVSGVTVNGQRPNGNKVYKLAVPNNGSDYETLNGDSVMTIKGLTYIVPEIVGGNNGVGYTYAVKETTDADFADNSDYATLNSNHGGDESVRDTSTTTIELSATQLMEKIAADGEKDFRFTIWDSTDGTTPGTDSNSAEILLRMNVALYDGIEPTVKLTPFYWNASGDGNNSVYYKDETVDEETQSVIQGHIELEDDLPSTFTDGGTGVNDRDPKVSGIIYLEGQAKDNVMINELTLSFPWLAESANPSFSSGFVSFASRTGGVISKVSGISLDQQGVEVVELSDDYDDSEYNIVKFKLAIDTSKIKDVARMDVELKVQAKDRGAANGEASTVKASSQLKNDETGNSPVYKMDIVPYITKLYTSISETAGEEFARSANGKYVVRGHYRTYSSEYKMWTDDMTETVRLYGFNLKAGTGAVKIGSSTINLSAGDTDDNGHYYYTFDVGKATVSGDLSVTVNSIESLNNKNANPEFKSLVNDTVTFAEYNCQANGITNNRLNDDVSLYVWDIHGFGTFYDTNITSPMMKMDKSGNYYMSYGYGVPYMYVRKNNTAHSVDGSFNKFHNTNVIFDDNGNLYAVATNTDRVYDQSSRFVFYTPYSAAQNNQLPTEITDTGYEYSTERDSKRHLELAYNSTTGVYDINRVKMPKLASYTKDSSTYIGMSYFDGNNTINPVKARFGYRDGERISGGISGSIGTYTNKIQRNVVTTESNNPTKTDSSYKDYHIIASDNTTFKGGAYTAVGIVPAAKAGTENNVGIVAWYDASVRKVCYSWNDNLDSPVVGGAWQTNAKYLDGKYTGWYVDLAVDDEGGIHIAYYNSAKGDLKYVYLSKYNATPTDAVTVDSYLSVGTNITVNTRLENGKYVPYIYYYNASANQTPNSIKVAWLNDMTTLRDGALSDKFTGAWECMTIPTENIPVDATVCGGVPTSGTYSKTVVLGYMSDQFYEKAYIKK